MYKYLNFHKISKKVLENQLNVMTVKMLGSLLQFDEIIESANSKSTKSQSFVKCPKAQKLFYLLRENA